MPPYCLIALVQVYKWPQAQVGSGSSCLVCLQCITRFDFQRNTVNHTWSLLSQHSTCKLQSEHLDLKSWLHLQPLLWSPLPCSPPSALATLDYCSFQPASRLLHFHKPTPLANDLISFLHLVNSVSFSKPNWMPSPPGNPSFSRQRVSCSGFGCLGFDLPLAPLKQHSLSAP